MIPSKVWVPALEVPGAYASMIEMREGIRWALVSVSRLSEEQRAKYCDEKKAKP